jgi:mono/diheme cytochrome c family protein/rhodanese-related sulfurtransferase
MSQPSPSPGGGAQPLLAIVSAFIIGVVLLVSWARPTHVAMPDPGESPEVTEGRALYTRYCALCHGARGEGHVADHAPALANEELLRIASDEYLTRSILEGRSGTPMSAFAEEAGGPLSDEDAAKIVAFLRSHQEAPSIRLIDEPLRGDPVRGMPIFREHCEECHAIEGRETKGPRLDHPAFLALASNAFITRTIRVGRPDTPMEGWQGRLRPDQINDLVALIRSWAPDDSPRRELFGGAEDPHDHGGHGDVSAQIVEMWDALADDELALGAPDAPGPAFDLSGQWYVSARQLRAALAADQRMILLDARPMSDWLVGHLPGSLPVPFYVDHESLDRIPKDGTWVVTYCGCPHAAADRVARRLEDRGVQNIAVLDEGFWFWKDNDYPVVTGPERFESGQSAR